MKLKYTLVIILSCGFIKSQTYLVTFASNAMSSSGGATKTDLSGANLFSVFYKPKSNDSIWGLKQLTNHVNKGEVFPSISPDTNWIAYNYSQKTPWHNEVRLIKRSNGAEYIVFSKGRFPHWISNNQLVLSDTQAVYITRLSYPTGTPNVVSNKKITSNTITPNINQCEDPFPFNNGTKVLFHGYNSITGSTALCQIDSNGTNFLKLTSFSAYGHGVVASNNTEILASQAGGSQPLRFATNTSTFSPIALNLPTSQTLMSTYDVRYGTAASIKWAYVSLGYNDRSFFASCSGEDASNNYYITRLFYIEYNAGFSSYTLYDFSKKIEQKLGVSAKDFISSAAITLSMPSAGINEKTKQASNILVYPNPTNSVINVEFLVFDNEPYTIELFNIIGQLLYKETATTKNLTLKTDNLQKGVYFVKATVDGKTKIVKIVKE